MARNIVPRTNKGADLGTPAKNWNTVYTDKVVANVVDGGNLGAVEQSAGDEVTLRSLIAAAGSNPTSITVYNDIPITTTDLTIPSNIYLRFKDAGKLSPESGITLTINGTVEAGLWQIFGNDGNILGPFNTQTVYPEWFGAIGDGVTDDTDAIQKAINVADKNIDFDNKTYKVSKTSNFASYFPDNDQPCLFVYGKDGFCINGNKAVLKVNNHAQGILEIQQSNNLVVDNLTVQGPGNFPPLDGTTGRGEKGNLDGGYNTVDFWGFHKNNSYDTSLNNTGGFNGQFPQWEGGTASTWGMWNNGFIGNVAHGILVHNNCHNIVIKRCVAFGFNYCGISVGHYNSSNYSYDVKFLDCTSHDNYSANFNTQVVDRFTLIGCLSYNAGHPNANPSSDTWVDPGYGYTARLTSTSLQTKTARIIDSTFKDNKRKGIDFHRAEKAIVIGNISENSGNCGIFVARTSDAIVKNNIVNNCSWANDRAASIHVERTDDAIGDINCLISGNTLKNIWYHGIWARECHNLVISKNRIDNVAIGTTDTVSAIVAGNTNIPGADYASITDNFLDMGTITQDLNGIFLINVKTGVVGNNIIKMIGRDASRGVMLNNSTNIITTNNNIVTDESSLSREYSMRTPEVISLYINFNGTETPVYTVRSGKLFVNSVVSDPYGVKINLQSIPNSKQVYHCTTSIKSSGGLETSTGAVEKIYIRQNSYNTVIIGFKDAWASYHISGSAVISGILDILIWLV